MLESENQFKGLNLSLLKVVTVLNSNSFFFLEKLILSDHLLLLLLFFVDLDGKDFVEVLLESLKLFRSDSDDGAVDREADATDKFGVFGVSVEDKLEEKVSLFCFVWLNYGWEADVMFKLILDSKVLHNEFISIKLLVSSQSQINTFKQTEDDFPPQLIMHTYQTDPERHQFNGVLVIYLIVSFLFLLNEFQLFDITFKLQHQS